MRVSRIFNCSISFVFVIFFAPIEMRTLPDSDMDMDVDVDDVVLDLISLLHTHLHTLSELEGMDTDDVIDQLDDMYDTMLEWQTENDFSVSSVLLPVDPYHFDLDDLAHWRHAYQSFLDTLIK